MEISIVKIKKVVDGLIQWCRQDLVNNVNTPTFSWLYLTFSDTDIDDTNFYIALKSLISQGDDDKRKLKSRLMFDKERASLPTIHIHYPSESSSGGDNTLNTGYLSTELVNNRNVNVYSRSFVGQYELVITGGNSLEVVMLYEFFDALLIAAADTLAYNFDKFEFSGRQLLANQEIIPFMTYYRAIGLTLQDKKTVYSITNFPIITDIQFHMTPYIDGQQPADQVVSVSITSDKESGAIGETVTFAATPINGGSNPLYNWYVNDFMIESTSNLFQATISTNDILNVSCRLFSDIAYAQPSPAISNTITIIAL